MFDAENDNFYYTYNMNSNGSKTTSLNTYLFKLNRKDGLFYMSLASHKVNDPHLNHKLGRNIARMRIKTNPFILPLELTYDILKNNEYRLNSIDLYYCLLESEEDYAKRMLLYEKYIEYCEKKSPDEIIKLSPYFSNNLLFKNGNSIFWDFTSYFLERFNNWKDYLIQTYKEKSKEELNKDFNNCYIVISEFNIKQQEKLQNKQFRESRKNVKNKNI